MEVHWDIVGALLVLWVLLVELEVLRQAFYLGKPIRTYDRFLQILDNVTKWTIVAYAVLAGFLLVM